MGDQRQRLFVEDMERQICDKCYKPAGVLIPIVMGRYVKNSIFP